MLLPVPDGWDPARVILEVFRDSWRNVRNNRAESPTPMWERASLQPPAPARLGGICGGAARLQLPSALSILGQHRGNGEKLPGEVFGVRMSHCTPGMCQSTEKVLPLCLNPAPPGDPAPTQGEGGRERTGPLCHQLSPNSDSRDWWEHLRHPKSSRTCSVPAHIPRTPSRALPVK